MRKRSIDAISSAKAEGRIARTDHLPFNRKQASLLRLFFHAHRASAKVVGLVLMVCANYHE